MLFSFSKVLEKIICTHLIEFRNDSNNISKRQSISLNNPSTNQVVGVLVDNVSIACDSSKAATGCFIDLRMAFKPVNYYILITKFGFMASMIISWTMSFANGSQSDLMHISCGVPQRSILGLLLFILYIDNPSNTSIFLTYILFTDDTKIIVQFDKVSDAANILTNSTIN